MRKKSETYYTCGTDWLHEPIDDIKFYKSEKLLKKARTCVEECGIAKVEMTARWKKKGTL